MTRVALLADLHGARAVLAAVLAEADELGIDHVVVAGDYLDCRVGKRRAPGYAAATVADVVELDPLLWQLLGRCLLVRGNQEERIDVLTDTLPRPGVLPGLLRAPATRRVAGLTIVHGHRFDWSRCSDLWVPTLDADLPDDRLLVFGHSHQALVTTLVPDADGAPRHRPRPMTSGAVVRLDPQHRHLVNLGPASGADPQWVLYDDAEASVTLRSVRREVAGCGHAR